MLTPSVGIEPHRCLRAIRTCPADFNDLEIIELCLNAPPDYRNGDDGQLYRNIFCLRCNDKRGISKDINVTDKLEAVFSYQLIIVFHRSLYLSWTQKVHSLLGIACIFYITYRQIVSNFRLKRSIKAKKKFFLGIPNQFLQHGCLPLNSCYKRQKTVRWKWLCYPKKTSTFIAFIRSSGITISCCFDL